MNLAHLLSQHLFRHYDKTGNANVFVVLRERHYEILLDWIVAYYVRDRVAAEAIVNETFDIVREKYREYDESKPFTDWLYALAATCAMKRTIIKRRRRELNAKVKALPAKQRQLLGYLFLDNLPESQIAKRLGMTVKQTRKSLDSALTKLKCEWRPC